MLHLVETCLSLPREKLRKWCSILPLMLMLVNVFSPTISFMAFHLHFDKHLVECQQQHRHHAEDCQASCILEEMVPEPVETTPGRTVSFIYFSPDLFFQNHLLVPTARLHHIMMVNYFSRHLLPYSPPFLGTLSPPPKLYANPVQSAFRTGR